MMIKYFTGLFTDFLHREKAEKDTSEILGESSEPPWL